MTWRNDDTAAHTITSGTAAGGLTGLFNSNLFMSGQTFSYTFKESGLVDYYCMVHPWMNGRVIVNVVNAETQPNLESKSDEPISKQVKASNPTGKAFDYIHKQQKTNAIKVLDYYLYRYVNEVNFAQWWDKRFPEADLFVMSNRYGSVDDLNCEKNKMRYIPPTKEKPPSCLNMVSYFKTKYNFPDPTKSQQHYFDRYNNEPKWKAWFDYWFEGYTLEEIVGYLDPILIPAPTTRSIGYDIDNECELAYYISYHLHFNTWKGSPFDYDQEKITEIAEGLPEELNKELRKKYETWEIEARMIPDEEYVRIYQNVLAKLYGELTDVTMKENDVSPKLKEQVQSVVTFPGSDKESQLTALYTKSLLHPDQYGKDKTCEKKYLKYFGDSVVQDLQTIHGDKAQIIYDEIISRVYD